MQLTDWMLENCKALHLKADKYTWIDEWIPGYFDYGVIIEIHGKEYSGRGIDRDEATAFEKASAEALERAVISEAQLDMPWGTAAYPTIEGAKTKAYYELLGIDRVFCHHFCRKQFYELNLSKVGECFPIEKTKEVLLKNGISLNLYELRPTLDAKIVCAIAWGNRYFKFNGFIAGFGADQALENAKLHAIVECLRTTVVTLCTHYVPEKPIERLKQDGEPRWHFWMAQTEQVSNYVKTELVSSQGKGIVLHPEVVSIDDIHFKEFRFKNNLFPDIPLYFFQASSEKLIVPQFGPFTADSKTMNRLMQFADFDIENVTSVPHFYG